MLPGCSWGQKYTYAQYHASTGAPFEAVSTVVQDQAGFIWIGSTTGLYRFDGGVFEHYSIHTQSQFIHELHTSGDEVIFVNDIGIYHIENLDGQPEVSTILEGGITAQPNLPFYPNDFIVGEVGELWLSQSNHSVGRLTEDGYQSYPFSPAEEQEHISLFKAPNGNIWALSRHDGLFVFNEEKNSFAKKLNTQEGAKIFIHGEYLLIGEHKLQIYELNEDELTYIRSIEIPYDLITAITVDESDRFILGTEKGKLYFIRDLMEEAVSIYGANDPHRVEELEFGKIREIYTTIDSASHRGMLWVCSETGLWLLQQYFFETVEHLPKTNPFGIAMAADDRVYVAMNSLYELTPKEEGYYGNQKFIGMQINTVASDASEHVWFAAASPEIELIKVKNDRIMRRYDFTDRGDAIFFINADSRNSVWFCQAPLDKPLIGLGKINAGGEVVFYDETKGFSSRVLVIRENSRGELFAAGIGEKSYLYKYDENSDRFENISPALPFVSVSNFEVHDLAFDHRHVLWMASSEGLLRFDSEKIAHISNDLLGRGEIRGVAHIADGHLWVSTAANGLVYYQDQSCTAMGASTGLPSVINAYRCLSTDANGRIWAGTAEGLVHSRMPNAMLPRSNKPKVRKIEINKHATDAHDVFHKIRSDDRMDVHYTNLSFPSHDVEYQYRIMPKSERAVLLEDNIWTPNGRNSMLTLNNIDIGDYFLEIRARQPGGFQWSDAAELELEVYQPWYKQDWFVFLILGLIVVVGGYYFQLFARQRIQKLQQVLKYANSKLAEREAELNEKIIELDEQKEELLNAMSNIQTLELFIREIPIKPTWNDIITAMGKAVVQSIDVDAFEICFIDNKRIFHKGYSNQEEGGYTFRSNSFNPKTSITSWAIENDTEVIINDFHKEHIMFIEPKEAYLFNSLIFVPFRMKNDRPAALCAYSVNNNQFDHNDVVMVRTLARFIKLSAEEEIMNTL